MRYFLLFLQKVVLRKSDSFSLSDNLIDKALHWANHHFQHLAFFNNHKIGFPFEPFPRMLAAGALDVFEDRIESFEGLKKFCSKSNDWLAGYFTYDLKNQIEQLSSSNPDRMAFPKILFFRPQNLIFFKEKEIIIESVDDPADVYDAIINFPIPKTYEAPKLKIFSGMDKSEYIGKVQAIKNHIVEGDIYEMNFCIEFHTEMAEIDPVNAYLNLSAISPMPFSAFMKFHDGYLISASPERFLKKEGNQLISQPIKGTIKRGKDSKEDELLKFRLQNDEKERAENMMIVDLVRNDLAKSSKPGTVKVDEIFGIYTFEQVHQMISTVTSQIKADVHFIDAIKNAFPMGSMTGAPKIKVMELIDRYENSARGLYSGAAGFITPDNDFDFNVVIRSILYNRNMKTVSYQSGSAITYDSDPDSEYEECLLKAKAFFQLFGGAGGDMEKK